MITIYHNPRCSKSREALAILESKHLNIQIIKYLDEPLSVEELKNIIQKLNIKPMELVRKNEAIWKEKFKDSELSDEDIIFILSKYPKLIERPIIINGDKATIGRPPQKILDIL